MFTDARLRGLFTAIGVTVGSLLPFIVLLLTDRGLSPAQSGLVVAAMGAAGVVANPMWGRLADHLGNPALILRMAAALSVVAVGFLWLAGSSYALLLGAVCALGAVRSPGEALADTVAVRSLGGRAGHSYGRIRLWSSIGYAASLAVWSIVLRYLSLNWTLAGFACSMAAVWYAARVPGSQRVVASPADFPRIRGLGGAGRVFTGFLAGVLLLGVGMGAAVTFFPLWVIRVGGSVSLVAIAGLLGALAEVPLMMWSGAVRRWIGGRGMFLAGGAAYVLTLAIWSAQPDPRVAVALSVIRGSGYALIYVGLVTSAANLLPHSALSTGNSLLQTTLMGVAPIVGSSLGGLVFQNLGAPALFQLAAVTHAVGVGVIVLAVTRARAVERHASGA